VQVHHLNCGTLCPLTERLVEGRGRLLRHAERICRVLLLEGKHGLILVDTGLGTQGCLHPIRHYGLPFVATCRPKLRQPETAFEQVRARGYDPRDVRHIVLTHLDLDHAGGLPDFPEADIHVFDLELTAVQHPRTLLERLRYSQRQFRHGPRWRAHESSGERWLGFEAVRPLRLDGLDVLLVPLPGHSRGHCGVAVGTPEGWLLQAGDCILHHREIEGTRYSCPPVLRLAQWAVQHDGRQRAANRERLRSLKQEHPEVKIVCSHDPN
jgi:glyoxylase-like metal-dependent hydrolase (beta-lactamase superfamily II)